VFTVAERETRVRQRVLELAATDRAAKRSDNRIRAFCTRKTRLSPAVERFDGPTRQLFVITAAGDHAAAEVATEQRSADDPRARAFARGIDRRALDAAYRYATLILGDRTEAEDATHDAALTAWRRFSDLRDAEKFDAWFGRILVNACRDRLRARRVRVREIDAREPHPNATDPIATITHRHVLAEALATLSLDHREVVVLRFWADLTIDQIAERTAVSTGTVKSRLHYALRRLRENLGTEHEGADR
jgi:RNA polymerase sigma-70 factor (ECF subfamily)